MASTAQAQAPVRLHMTLPDRAENLSGSARRMCSCDGRTLNRLAVLHDYATASVKDTDLREALLRGVSETGVPKIEND